MKRPLLPGIARMFSVLSQLPATQDAKIVIRMSTPRMSLKISPVDIYNLENVVI